MTLPILHRANQPARRTTGENVRDTALSPFAPWRELNEMTRWFDEFMGRNFGPSLYNQGPNAGVAAVAAPAIDLYESPDELRLFAYLPGANKDGFDISVTGNTLSIRGERAPLIEGEGWTGYGSGIAQAQGAFEATYSLPVEVDAAKVNATYHEGVLELHLPKAETAKVKSVKVNVQNR
jgi:HSP20 family protein